MNKRLILVRHGESEWNKLNLFTGWTDVDLSDKGVQEAVDAGKAIREYGAQFGFKPTICFTSYLKRAIKTLNVILDEMDLDYLPVYKSWRLNEKHYGALQGLNKQETAEKYGEQQVFKWRRVYDCRPAALEPDDKRSPYLDKRYEDVPQKDLPLTESLQDCIGRCLPYLTGTIIPAFMQHDTILVVAHGNSLRGVVKYLRNMSDERINQLNIPTALPMVFSFDNKTMEFQHDAFLGEPEKVRKLMEQVDNQAL